jgi:hypothetical protein
VKDRFFCLADGRFTGLMAAFDRDAAGRIPEVTLDVYGWRIRAARLID